MCAMGEYGLGFVAFAVVFYIGYCQYVSVKQPQRDFNFKRIAASGVSAGVLDVTEYYSSVGNFCNRGSRPDIGIQAPSELF